MNNTFPEPVQFYLDTCERVSDLGAKQGDKSLTPVEHIVLRAYKFGCDVDNGGLSGFFYNIAVASAVAEDTALSLEAIGASNTAALLRSAAVIVCRSDSTDNSNTWGDYLAAVDPTDHLEHCDNQLSQTNEDIFSLLEIYILLHRDALTTAKERDYKRADRR